MAGPESRAVRADVPSGPAELARRCRPTGSVLNPTTVVAAIAGTPAGHPVGTFLRSLFDATDRPTVPNLPGPMQVSGDQLSAGDKRMAGTVFDVALRQHLGADVSDSIGWALERAAAMGLPYPTAALDEGARRLAQAADPNFPDNRTRDRRLRDAIVVAWCETATRSEFATVGSPLAEMPGLRTWNELADRAPENLLADAGDLLKLAEAALVPGLQAAGVRCHVELSCGPIRAEADLITGSTVLDLKTGAGRHVRGGPTFPIGKATLRQLTAYALMPAAVSYDVTSIGVYAARFGRTWKSPLEHLLAETTWDAGPLADMRAAMAHVLAPPYTTLA